MTYEVQTLCYPDTWENTWSDSLGDTPVQFDTYEAAAQELAEFLSELAYAVKQGFVTDFDNSAYRIKKV
jgi:hypothetical protein